MDLLKRAEVYNMATIIKNKIVNAVIKNAPDDMIKNDLYFTALFNAVINVLCNLSINYNISYNIMIKTIEEIWSELTCKKKKMMN